MNIYALKGWWLNPSKDLQTEVVQKMDLGTIWTCISTEPRAEQLPSGPRAAAGAGSTPLAG